MCLYSSRTQPEKLALFWSHLAAIGSKELLLQICRQGGNPADNLNCHGKIDAYGAVYGCFPTVLTQCGERTYNLGVTALDGKQRRPARVGLNRLPAPPRRSP